MVFDFAGVPGLYDDAELYVGNDDWIVSLADRENSLFASKKVTPLGSLSYVIPGWEADCSLY